jgi:hypothetical protein
MKLELKKTTQPNGDIFYQVFKDNCIEKSFWVGNPLTNSVGYGEEAALSMAKDMYERMKINGDPIVEIIQSETIETTTNEPA